MSKILIDEAAVTLVLAALHVLLTEPSASTTANKAKSLLLQAAPVLAKALAEQPAHQEPVAWWDAKLGVFNEKHFDQLQPLCHCSQAQPAREWVGLTAADMKTPDMGEYVFLSEDWIDGCKTGMENAEAKLKEKNT